MHAYKERITMRDIAQKAGVHVTSVSLALRNHPSLPLPTRKRLQRLAQQLGYQPDPALTALVAYRNHARAKTTKSTLAYVTHWDSRLGWKASPAHRAFYEGACEKAASLGFRIEHFWMGEPGLTHQRMSQILRARGIAGLILASHKRDTAEALEFDWSHFCAVKIDYSPVQPQLHMVTNDQARIVRLAMQQVMASGYRRIGLVIPRWWDEFVDLAWSAGFLAEQQRLLPEERIPILAYTPAAPPSDRPSPSAQVAPTQLLDQWLKTYSPEVLLSRPAYVQPSLSHLGLTVPTDIGLVDLFLEKPDGQTAGIRQNCTRVGELAVELVASQLQQNAYGIPAVPTATFVEGTWFEGASLPVWDSRAILQLEQETRFDQPEHCLS